MSLDACVVAGNTFFPFPFFSFFSLLSLPLPPVGTLEWVATRGSWPYYWDATLLLLGVPGLTTRRKDALGQRCLPLGRRVCVPLVITGIPLNCCFFLAGGPWTLGWHGPTKTHPSCRENVPAWCTWAHYKMQLVATLLPSCKVLVSSADLHATTSPCRSVVGLRFGPPFLLKTSRIRGSYLYP